MHHQNMSFNEIPDIEECDIYGKYDFNSIPQDLSGETESSSADETLESDAVEDFISVKLSESHLLLPLMSNRYTNSPHDDLRDHRDLVLQHYHRTYNRKSYGSLTVAIRKALRNAGYKKKDYRVHCDGNKDPTQAICDALRITVILAKRDTIHYWSFDDSGEIHTPDVVVITPREGLYYGTRPLD